MPPRSRPKRDARARRVSSETLLYVVGVAFAALTFGRGALSLLRPSDSPRASSSSSTPPPPRLYLLHVPSSGGTTTGAASLPAGTRGPLPGRC